MHQFWAFSLIFFALVSLGAESSQSRNLEAFLQTAQNESEALLAIQKKLAAVQAEIEGRDILLSSQFTLLAENFNNDQDAVMFARRSRARFVDATFAQPFSTGTLLTFNAGHERSVIDNFGLRQIADWEVRLSQSLWRDGFGRDTSLRHQGEKDELFRRRAALLYEQNLILIDLESIYWDALRLSQEEQILTKNLEVSRELLKWMQNRIKRLAAEKSDLLQVQALVSGQELDLITVQNQRASLKARLQTILPQFQIEQISGDSLALNEERSLLKFASTSENSKDIPMRWDSLSSEALAREAEVNAQRVREQLKPQFDVYMSYGQNGIADSFDSAWSRAGNDRFSGTRVGVIFSVPLHRGITSKQEQSARLQAEAQQLEARAQRRTSQISWQELERLQKVVKTQSLEATRLSEFQTQKALEERRRYKIGRSTLFQLVSFEIEAAQAAVRKFTFLANLRKVESQARLFTTERSPQ